MKPIDVIKDLFEDRVRIKLKPIINLDRLKTPKRLHIAPRGGLSLVQRSMPSLEAVFGKRAPVHKGSWWSETTYVPGDTVRFGGSTFKATRACWGDRPGRSNAWRLVR